MFDLNNPEVSRTKRADVPDGDMGESEPDAKPPHPLDSSAMRELHTRLIAYYQEELDRQQLNREQMAIDEDFADHIQWSEEDAAILRGRGQNPMVFNVAATSLRWIIGSEKRGRTDSKVLPRRKEESKAAERKTQLMKYLSDQTGKPFHRSRAFEDAVIAGIGWLECGQQDDSENEPVYTKYETWRNILHDSAGNGLVGEDWRYMFRSKWVDEDIACALHPDREQEIRSAAGDSMQMGGYLAFGDDAMDSIEDDRENSGGPFSGISGRRRVRMIECWYFAPMMVDRMYGGDSHGEIYDPGNQRHAAEIADGSSMTRKRMALRMQLAIMTVRDLLWQGNSPYKHNKFPFTPIWCFRRKRTGLPYGFMRGLRDIQEDINKRFSKALHILSTNKTIMDEGAVPSLQEFIEENARPDGILIKKQGKELVLNADRGLEEAHLQIMLHNISLVQQVGGVTDEQKGLKTNATSGVAIEARQDQGQLTTSSAFDNLRLAEKVHGEKELSLIEQFYSEQKSFRITNMRGTPEYVTVNDGLPENDIAHTRADFVISEADWRATMRQASTDQLVDMMSKMPPQVQIVVLDLLVESMDIANRDEIVRRIRAINGQKDPDQTEPTPEDIEKQQAMAQQQAFQMELAKAQLQALQAKGSKDGADADRIKALTNQINAMTVQMNVTSQQNAILAAQSALAVGVPAVADSILNEAGFVPVPQQRQMLLDAAMKQDLAARQQAAAARNQQQQAVQQQPPAAPAAQPMGIPQ